ncbi:MAG: class I SAM-dependent methyltransferase [Nocardioides sp.]
MPEPRSILADTFRFAGVAEAHHARPPYPHETIEMLTDLAGGAGARVLDIGAGEGAVARPLASRVARVDAVEASAAMVRVGRAMPGGEAANLHWHLERAEDASPTGPFDLVVAGAAMHWFDLETVCHRVRRVTGDLSPLAMCDRSVQHPGLASVVDVIRRYSRAPEYDPDYEVADEMTARGLWSRRGEHRTKPVPFPQSPQEYLLGLRSTSTLARELMSASDNDAFDREILQLTALMTGADGLIRFSLTSSIVWGTLT